MNSNACRIQKLRRNGYFGHYDRRAKSLSSLFQLFQHIKISRFRSKWPIPGMLTQPLLPASWLNENTGSLVVPSYPTSTWYLLFQYLENLSFVNRIELHAIIFNKYSFCHIALSFHKEDSQKKETIGPRYNGKWSMIRLLMSQIWKYEYLGGIWTLIKKSFSKIGGRRENKRRLYRWSGLFGQGTGIYKWEPALFRVHAASCFCAWELK